jgi:nucleotide-binding universal stress UspA family protein
VSTDIDTKRPLHIVLAYDFSAPSELALDEAARKASERGNAIIHLVHVSEAPVPRGKTEQLDIELTARIEPNVRSALSSVDASPDIRIFTHVRHGHAATEVLALADEVEADLILVGTHGRHGIKRIMLGSVAEQIVRDACCPVLVVRTRSYAPALEPEPPCEACVRARNVTHGAEWWCAEHSKPWSPPHRYSYRDGNLRSYHSDGSDIF